MVLCGTVAAGTVSQEVTNARQESQIWTTYALSPYLRASDLKVSVQNGKATLTGTVEEEANKELAKEIALGVNGIKEVDNKILVQVDSVPSKRTSVRSYGEVIDDVTITAVVKSKLLWSKFRDNLTTNVDTKFGRVTLTGTADSAVAKENAGSLARNTRGVVSVDNNLVVDGIKPNVVDSAKSSFDKAGQDISDSWITTKVKYTFLYSSNVAGSDITVTTNGGIVKLSGKVGSGTERDLAITLAQNVRGVKNVTAKDLTF
jgi:osmotically-inducible protein OsmY